MRYGLAIVAALACAAGAAMGRPTYTATGPVPIPDAGPGDCATSPPGPPATLDITVPDSLTITKVTVGVWVQHTWQADVKLSIEKVGSGTSVVLINRPGSPKVGPTCGFSNDDYGASQTALFQMDDAAVNVYDNPPLLAGINQVQGLYKSHTPLSAFNGMNSQGTWRVSAIDNAELDFGTVQFVRLDITGGTSCYPDCNQDNALTIADFGCFQGKFVNQDPYADCNGDSAFTIADFGCFQGKFVTGCP